MGGEDLRTLRRRAEDSERRLENPEIIPETMREY
jgi:hypothetical protein